MESKYLTHFLTNQMQIRHQRWSDLELYLAGKLKMRQKVRES